MEGGMGSLGLLSKSDLVCCMKDIQNVEPGAWIRQHPVDTMTFL